MTQKYKLIIFDLGNVIFHISFDETFKYWAEHCSLDLVTIRERFVFDDAHIAFEKGILSEEGFCQHISQLLNINLPFELFNRGWNELYLEPLDGIEQVLIDLKKDYKIVALSNTNATHERVFPQKFAHLLSHFDRLFYSHQIHAVKPESAAYRTVLDAMQVDPELAIFLDDKQENIAGAMAMSMEGIVVENAAQMYRDLGKLLNRNISRSQ